MREEFDAPLAALTTMRVGGPAARVVTVETIDEIVDAVRETDEAQEPLLLLSGGSNLVIADDGFAGTVVRIASRGITVESVDSCGGALIRVAAGETWEDVVDRAVGEGWAGVECLAGIPGLAGSTPVQNVGAYGQDVAQTVWNVRVWDRLAGRVRTLANAECAFAYRHSLFKATDQYVVLDVAFQLEVADLSRPLAYADLARALDVPLGTRVPLADARAAVLDQRRRRGMVWDAADPDTWGCGSFFTNPILSAEAFADLTDRVGSRLGPQIVPPRYPQDDGRVKTSAAWLIERAGFGPGFGLPGPAALSTKHVLAITNRGEAGARDVLALARTVRDGVADVFGVRLVNEPVLVGLEL